MTLITLVRHGQTDWNLEGRIQGSTDIPLNDTGRAQARDAARRLAGTPFDHVYASPLSRARETAEIIASELGLPAPLITVGMREHEFGDAEGMLWDQYVERFRARREEVPGAETVPALTARALASLDRIALAARRRSAPRVESVLICTHGGVIRALLEHVSGGTLPAPGERLGNGSVHRFAMDGGGLRLLDTAAV
ncbi:2,3-bisphosphoglycerate-dependent phosphoglycerate mutase [Microbacterium sp. 8M]|uniref:histidine phosphatase family protein n=1 Tax=Microbacterium sp. 8M TaxID=2653153 RepID=UPI0012F045BF|nr:histidine phosphatase family protein [Microbacterium sp. 8M]VXC22985.1 2,3-bisphosphoglycerate-dependent phosphoglycerate mutase [Microbacterium sp. 8M]